MTSNTQGLFAALALAFLAAACGGDEMSDEDVAALRADIRTARTEITRHQDACAAAAELGELPTELDRHAERMDGIRSGMDSRMSGMMSHCSGSGMGKMHEMMGSMTSEMQSHREDVANAPTLDEARAECTSHSEAMNDMLDEMNRSLGDVGCMMGR